MENSNSKKWLKPGSRQCLIRRGLPEDVGELAVFPASDKAGFIHGETIVIDGGVNRKLARSANV